VIDEGVCARVAPSNEGKAPGTKDPGVEDPGSSGCVRLCGFLSAPAPLREKCGTARLREMGRQASKLTETPLGFVTERSSTSGDKGTNTSGAKLTTQKAFGMKASSSLSAVQRWGCERTLCSPRPTCGGRPRRDDPCFIANTCVELLKRTTGDYLFGTITASSTGAQPSAHYRAK
jgi:hypothetical protein